jgi:hypothetical protein
MTAAETPSWAYDLVAELMAAYHVGAKVAPETVRVYAHDLADLPPSACALAVKTLRQTSRFLPSIAEVRQATAEITGGHLPDGDEAWGEVQRQIKQTGYYGKPRFSHPAIAATVRAMGWQELCASENQVADRAHFLTLYGTARRRLERERQVDPEVRELAATLAAAYELERPLPDDLRPEEPAELPAPHASPLPIRALLDAVKPHVPDPADRDAQLDALRKAFPDDDFEAGP